MDAGAGIELRLTSAFAERGAGQRHKLDACKQVSLILHPKKEKGVDVTAIQHVGLTEFAGDVTADACPRQGSLLIIAIVPSGNADCWSETRVQSPTTSEMPVEGWAQTQSVQG